MEIFGVDAWDEKKCVHASTLETGLMHGVERQELVHHFWKRGRAAPAQGPSRRRGQGILVGRRLQREGFWSMGSGVEPAGCQGSRAAIYSS